MSIVDPIKAPLQFAVLEYIKAHCCMSASNAVVRAAIDFRHVSGGTVNTAIRQLKKKGLVVGDKESKGRYHYYVCENY